MSTQTALGHSFPTLCKRCGGALYRQVNYCPYCGAAHPLDESPHKRSALSGSRAEAMSPAGQHFDDEPDVRGETDLTTRAAHPADALARQAVRPTSLVSTAAPVPPPQEFDDDPPPYPAYNTGLTARKVLLAIGAVFLLALGYALYVLFSDSSDTEDNVGDQTTVATQDARSTTGTIAPFAAPAQPDRPVATIKPAISDNAVKAAPAVAVRPATPDNVVKATPVVPATPAPPPAVTAPPVIAAPAKPAQQFRDASQALQSARLAFRANDLSAAQASLAAAQSLQPGNADVQNLAADLRPLIARRDSALQAAQTCVAQQSWPCARQHANEALAIDTGNDTAKLILARVIRETGWAPLNPHAGGAAPAQGKPLAQAQPAPGSQAVQLQTPLPPGMPANDQLIATAPSATAAGGGANGNSLVAHERAIKGSGWHRSPSIGGKLAANPSPSQ
ncbi:hypothetical protein FVF58_24640 [Paraburkholderia panacisoli]|uniref:Zinc ribbon domain-containing protein n=1 Tax=Paraburkholderia panacisoli TaxID=2603818 RepID=A0A5B0GWR0_9BURK|nr:hypothetical protein [Paraburkholderia panacisoli]KAA1007314.1 hypothetical protein FVF58_24640 [Paraburkholderia panacisoli]